MAGTKFTDRWPQVREMKVLGKQTHTRRGRPEPWVAIMALPEDRLIHCDYKGCLDGGFLIETELDDVIRQLKTSGRTFVICRGKEPMGRSVKRDCANHLELEYEISYK